MTQRETVYENINVFTPGETIEINLNNNNKKIVNLEKLTDLIDQRKIEDNFKKTKRNFGAI